MKHIIDKNRWHICKICNSDIRTLAKTYGGSNIYFTQVFQKHLEKDHSITIDQYFNDAPKCKCGICDKTVKISRYGANFYYREYACGRNEGVIEWSKNAKIARTGSGNPMFGKKPWNKDLTKKTSASLQKVADKNTGRKVTNEAKTKMSESAKKRKIHGHTGHQHDKEIKEKIRQNTLRMIKDGKFKQNNTTPIRIFQTLFDKNNITYEQEKQLCVWSFDFFLPTYNIYIEVDGDYFHSNPLIYKNGPKTKTQKINWYRDIKKNKFCQDNNIQLYRFWEFDIINNIDEVEKSLLCILKK